jgi:AmiR/NasT family two-component response regulator
MKQKILVNVENLFAKKIILSTIVSVGYDFVEANTYNDIKFKCDLLKGNIIIYVHELDYSVFEEEIAYIKNIIARGIKVVLIIDDYDVNIIDEAINIGVHDIVEMPIDRQILAKKLNSFVFKEQVVEIDVSKQVEDASLKKFNEKVIHNEIARAVRGNYQVSMIMVDNLSGDSGLTENIIHVFKNQMRDTDKVLNYADNRILLVCPFTVKSYIVEVENKVRNIYKEIHKDDRLFVLYGLTYPEDVDDTEAILKRLEKGIENSIALRNFTGTLSDIGFEQFEAYKKMLK